MCGGYEVKYLILILIFLTGCSTVRYSVSEPKKPNAVYLNLDKMNNPKYMLTWYIAGESDTLKVQRLTHTASIYWRKNDTLYVYVPKP